MTHDLSGKEDDARGFVSPDSSHDIPLQLQNTYASGERSSRNFWRAGKWGQKITLVLTDALSILAASAFGAQIAAVISEALWQRPYLTLESGTIWERFIHTSVLTAILLGWWAMRGHYTRRSPFWAELKDICQGLAIIALLDAASLFLQQRQFSRLWILQAWFWATLAVPVGRALIRSLLTRLDAWIVPVVIIGDDTNALDAVDALHSETYLGYRVVAVVPTSTLFANKESPDTSELIETLPAICARHSARFVILAPSAGSLDRLQDLLRRLHTTRIPFAVIPPLRGLPVLNMNAGYFFSHDVMMLSMSNNLARPISRFVKRLFDLSIALVALTFLSPFFIFASILIRTDKGHAFYGHKRVGRNGEIFPCLKFRTMVMDADKKLEAVLASDPVMAEEWKRDQKLRNDPRVTPIGRFLRATSLDELPQLINVVRGDMSLVGPRPVTQTELEKYGDDASYYLEARPGITGLWQVSGRNDTGYERRVQLDCWYVRNWSLWQDIAILFKTMPAVLFKSGAY